MRRDQLEHAIRTACQIIGRPEVIVVGSQSILGTFREDELPADATMSVEIDILPIADGNAEIKRLADLIEGAAGELSPFEELHGFSIDGVDLETSVLPEGEKDQKLRRGPGTYRPRRRGRDREPFADRAGALQRRACARLAGGPSIACMRNVCRIRRTHGQEVAPSDTKRR